MDVGRRDQTRRIVLIVVWICGLYLAANIAYAVKSLGGVDMLPGHHGGLFPLGDWIYEHLKHIIGAQAHRLR